MPNDHRYQILIICRSNCSKKSGAYSLGAELST